MKSSIYFFYSVTLFILCTGCYSGKTVKGTIAHGGITREFILYIPATYTGNSPVPLVINLHGYTSNAKEQMWYGDFREIADTAGFIIVHPQGTKYRDTTHWNTGGWTPGSTVDDLGFLNDLIDTIKTQYKIDSKRIYAAGMSNGGEMSYHLACNLGNKIAAIASVSGAMTPETFKACHPNRPIPVLHFHGTDDHVVPYTGDPTATSILAGLNYWARNNRCDTFPIILHVPNTDTTDSSTVDHYIYRGLAAVEHFKIIGGDHAWPGAKFKFRGTNYDINASSEIWKFFNRFDLDGLRK